MLFLLKLLCVCVECIHYLLIVFCEELLNALRIISYLFYDENKVFYFIDNRALYFLQYMFYLCT